MILKLKRDIFSSDSTLGVLTIDDKSFGFTCEDPPRDVKIKKITCIPEGRYQIKTTMSPKYKRMMPILLDVPGFQGIRIHSGNNNKDTEGCILVGLTRDQSTMSIGKSRVACNWLYNAIWNEESQGNEVWIEISSLHSS